MNGEISMESTVGEGTTFKVILQDVPVPDIAMSVEYLPEEDPSEIIFEPSTILIFADIQNNIELIKEIISVRLIPTDF